MSPRTSRGAAIACAALALAGSANAGDLKNAGTAGDARQLSTVDYGAYQGTSFGAFMAPKGDFIDADGGVDLVFHFNAAMLAEKSWRRSDANAVIVSQAFSTFGTSPYEDAYSDQGRFGRMVTEVVASISRTQHRDNLHARRITLVGWSAGFAAVGKILSVPRYFDMVDSVVLLDGLHAQYTLRPGEPRGPNKGAGRVNVGQLSTFIRFASEAVQGRKQMVVTHTSIMTPDYASSTEASDALVREVGLTNATTDEAMFGMHLRTRAHKRNLHVLGFTGGNGEDHMKHLHAVGDVVRTWVTPRLSLLAAEDQEQRNQRASR
jgi:hypothetical protein